MRWPWQRKSGSVSTSEELLRALYGGSPTKSGAPVNWREALQVTTVLACARVIAEGVAQVPLKVYRETDDGGRQPAKDLALYNVLHRRPNPWQTSFELREQLALHLVLTGNAFCFINRLRGEVAELLPFEPGDVEVEQEEDRSITYTVTLKDRQKQIIPQSDMWHLRGPAWNGWMGLESVKLAREAIGLAMATEEHGARLFSNGARLSGVLSTDGALKADQIEALRSSWEQTYGGNVNAWKTAILWGGLKWAPAGLPSDQAQLIENRRHQIEEICRAFRVMPIMIGHPDKTATYASAEQMFLAHVVHTLMPWYERIEQSIDVNLLSESQVEQGYYAKFLPSGLLRGAAKDRGEFYATLYNIGAINPNEIRALEEMNPYQGGDDYRVPLNMEAPGAADPGE